MIVVVMIWHCFEWYKVYDFMKIIIISYDKFIVLYIHWSVAFQLLAVTHKLWFPAPSSFTHCSNWKGSRLGGGSRDAVSGDDVISPSLHHQSKEPLRLIITSEFQNFKMFIAFIRFFFILSMNQLKLQIHKARTIVQVLVCVRRWTHDFWPLVDDAL